MRIPSAWMGAKTMGWSKHIRMAAAACVAAAALIASADGATASTGQGVSHGPIAHTAGGWVQGTTRIRK